jgi:hypothetical protein
LLAVFPRRSQEECAMQLLAMLGQYLLLSFVLPGFCYLAIFVLCFAPAADQRGERPVLASIYDHIKASWITVAIIGGLLLSSVAFAIEVTLRYFVLIDCNLFPRIAFERIHEKGSADVGANFFAAESFMH